jgi:hypothetical protein
VDYGNLVIGCENKKDHLLERKIGTRISVRRSCCKVDGNPSNGESAQVMMSLIDNENDLVQPAQLPELKDP